MNVFGIIGRWMCMVLLVDECVWIVCWKWLEISKVWKLMQFLIPFKDWWGVPIKVAFDQTIWSGFWNSVYFVTLGILRLESPQSIVSELKATFWPMLSVWMGYIWYLVYDWLINGIRSKDFFIYYQAGWKLWPFAHVITYGVIPVEQRLLWVDCVELIWVTILSM